MSQKWFAMVGAVASLAMSVGTALPAAADPPKDPYPDTSKYAKFDFEGFRIADKPGVWFSSTSGLSCGIWDDGSFGCNGVIPGAPAGTNQVGWFSGEGSAHFDNTEQIRFTSGEAQRVLPANNYIEYRNVRCATTPENHLYCGGAGSGKGGYSGARFLITPGKTWLGNEQ
ncbi:hypothetical protein [Mycobacterium sp. D16Q16]|uniref:hypothetical protein n=1 Tax=Mycobacterium sp. D16Q16 TaxID=1855659 RepID=UPI000992DFC3|nr:hypothetical protein [Mycobacterium sp. D16Q16]